MLYLAVVLPLAACVPQTVRVPPPVLSPSELTAALAQQAAHEAALLVEPTWSLQGRVALSNGRNGGSGRIDWRQDGERYEVELSAPVTRQSWRLVGDASSARLDGLDGGPRSGRDPQTVLREATGWEIPVAALSSWARGARANQAAYGPARLEFGADQRLARIEQAGWVVDYTVWQPMAGSGVSALPMRLNAQKGEAKVRLVVDGWTSGAEIPVGSAR